MTDVTLERVNETHVRVLADPGIKMELNEVLTFQVEGYKYTPAYKMGRWDGYIRLLNTMTGMVYAGLDEHIAAFCADRGYTFQQVGATSKYNYDEEYVKGFLPEKYEARDYQLAAALHGINQNRTIVVSPTASGKSMIAYLMSKHHLSLGRRVLIIVPTVGLVDQMYKDFGEYDASVRVHGIRSGAAKQTDAEVVVTTWQSAVKLPQEFFRGFDVLIGDEAHTFKAKSLTSLMEQMPHVRFRVDMTGSLDGSVVNDLVLTGLFGPIHYVISTKELQDRGTLASLKIKGLVLKYTEEERRLVRNANMHKGMTYQEEIDFIVTNERRLKYVVKLALSLPGNTLILFQFVDKHGKKIFDELVKAGTHDVHFVHGGVSGDEREEIRQTVMNSRGNIIVASYQTFATGINIPLLDNLIYASPFKGIIRLKQSIGRVLRKDEKNGKLMAKLFDLVDDLRHKGRDNYAVRHFVLRSEAYAKGGFPMKVYEVDL